MDGTTKVLACEKYAERWKHLPFVSPYVEELLLVGVSSTRFHFCSKSLLRPITHFVVPSLTSPVQCSRRLQIFRRIPNEKNRLRFGHCFILSLTTFMWESSVSNPILKSSLHWKSTCSADGRQALNILAYPWTIATIQMAAGIGACFHGRANQWVVSGIDYFELRI